MKQTKRARAVTDYTELARLGPRDASASGSHHKIAESSTGYSEASSVAAVWEWASGHKSGGAGAYGCGALGPAAAFTPPTLLRSGERRR